MAEKFYRYLKKPFARYLVIGVSVYIFELVVILLATRAGVPSLVAVGLSFWLGLILSFLLQKIIAFKDKRMARHVLVPQIFAVCLLVLFNFGFTLGVSKILEDILPATITRTIALGITTVWNFYLYKTRIFKTANPIID